MAAAVCENMDESFSACKLAGCVVSVKGQKANSSSPTDTWTLTFNSRARFQGQPLNHAFTKIWAEPAGKPSRFVRALSYEIQVYKFLSAFLKTHPETPHCFVKHLFSAEHCSASEVVELVERAVKDAKTAGRALARSVAESAGTKRRESAIQDELSLNDTLQLDPALRFSLLVTELVPAKRPKNPARFMFDWLVERRNERVVSREVWQAMYQLVETCNLMASLGLIHGDLHLDNAWVVPLEKPVLLTFPSGISFWTNVLVMLYDFDRSYLQSLGAPSPMFAKQVPRRMLAPNVPVPGKLDLYEAWFLAHAIGGHLEIELERVLIELGVSRQTMDYFSDAGVKGSEYPRVRLIDVEYDPKFWDQLPNGQTLASKVATRLT